MASAIDATKPVQGSPTTQSVRDNFAAAKSEIELLQQTAGVGPQGPIGPVGPSGTVAVNPTVITGNPGTNASVAVGGTPQAATLQFTIPRGDAGTGGSGITETQAINAVRQGQVVFQEAPVTNAAAWPTTPNLAGAPVLGAGWSLVSGSGATGVYTQPANNWEALSYPVAFAANEWYQIVYTATRTSPLPIWGDTELYAYFGSSAGSGDYSVGTIRVGAGQQFVVIQAPATGLTHLVIQRDFGDWTGTFMLTRVVRHPGPQNSQTFNIKDFRMTVRGSSLYLGNQTGRWATGGLNLVIGHDAGIGITSASNNTVVGGGSFVNSAGTGNTVFGMYNMRESSGGNHNVALGYYSLYRLGSGGLNVALGVHTQQDLVTGSDNVALGTQALYPLITGSYNVAIGRDAGYYKSDGEHLTTCNYSIFIGNDSRADNDNQTNQIVIGYNTYGHGSRTITLGDGEITALYCNVQTISALSDSRVKTNIQAANLDMCLDAVKNLPVSRWTWQPIAGAHPDRNVTGFMAEDMGKIFPKSVTKENRHLPIRDANGNLQMVTPPVHAKSKAPAAKATKPAETAAPENVVEPQPIPKAEEFKDLQYVQPTELLPTLWGAVQRLIQQVEELRTQQPVPLETKVNQR